MTARKPTRRLAVSLLLGVATTIAVSWLAAIFADLSGFDFLPSPNTASTAYLRHVPPSDWTVRTWLVRSGLAIRHDLVSECVWMGSLLGTSPSTAPNRTREVVSVGWPLPAMQWTAHDESRFFESPPSSRETSLRLAWKHGLPQWSMRALSTGDERRLPLRPTAAGFILDTALFTAAAWWAVEWLTRLRTARRARRGACRACGYDLSGHGIIGAPCPECGAERPPGGESPPATISP